MIRPNDKFTHECFPETIFTAQWVPLSAVHRQVGKNEFETVPDLMVQAIDEKGEVYCFYESECKIEKKQS